MYMINAAERLRDGIPPLRLRLEHPASLVLQERIHESLRTGTDLSAPEINVCFLSTWADLPSVSSSGALVLAMWGPILTLVIVLCLILGARPH